jgi:hypothetical protein
LNSYQSFKIPRIALFHRNFGGNLIRGPTFSSVSISLETILWFSYIVSKHHNWKVSYILIPVGWQLTTNSNLTFFLFLCFENPLFQRSPKRSYILGRWRN